MSNSNPTQCERIESYMRQHGSISQREAIEAIGVYRLASRISEMRRRGMPIGSRRETVKNRYGEKCSFKRYFFEDGGN